MHVRSADPKYFIVQALQQIVWMGTAFRVSDTQEVAVARFTLTHTKQPGHTDHLGVHFDTSALSEKERKCWVPLFANPVIAEGFPIEKRMKDDKGLELSLQMMAALGGARHITEYDGSLIIKGEFAAFVPIECHESSVQWHCIRNSASPVSYEEIPLRIPHRAPLSTVDFASLEGKRMFLGWWALSESHMGTKDTDYERIDWSSAHACARPIKFMAIDLGFQSIATGKAGFIMGAKEGKLHPAQKAPFENVILRAEKTPVVLFDVDSRRGWLLSAIGVMLHVIQTKWHLKHYDVAGKRVDLVATEPESLDTLAAGKAAHANKGRLLYEGYQYQDAVLDLWSQIQRISAESQKSESSPGLTLHGTMRTKLHGFEFRSLVDGINFERRQIEVAKSSGGWVDLASAVGALTLLGTGFGEIIRPINVDAGLCRNWRYLPEHKDFLAARIPMIEELYAQAGSRIFHQYLSSNKLQWHKGGMLFEHCNEESLHHCECNRLQQIYHSERYRVLGSVRPPGRLEPRGCVIFGQSRFPLFRSASVSVARHQPLYKLSNIPYHGLVSKQTDRNDDSPQQPPPVETHHDEAGINGPEQVYPKRPSPPIISKMTANEFLQGEHRRASRRASHKGGLDKIDDHIIFPAACNNARAEMSYSLRRKEGQDDLCRHFPASRQTPTVIQPVKQQQDHMREHSETCTSKSVDLETGRHHCVMCGKDFFRRDALRRHTEGGCPKRLDVSFREDLVSSPARWSLTKRSGQLPRASE